MTYTLGIGTYKEGHELGHELLYQTSLTSLRKAAEGIVNIRRTW